MTRMTRMAGRAHARHTGAGSRRASVSGAPSGAAQTSRRRDRALRWGDRVALGVGIALALLMLAWFGWKLAQTVARDRAVTPGFAPAPAMPGH